MGGDWQRICDPDGVSPRNLRDNSPSVLGFRPRLVSPRLWTGILEVRVVTDWQLGGEEVRSTHMVEPDCLGSNPGSATCQGI